MKCKRVSLFMTAILALGLFAGCSTGSGGTALEPADTQAGVQETVLSSGRVELRVWAEEANFDMLNQMIESFKQEYAGQADFEITLEAATDSDTKNNVLADVHNAADVFPMADDQVSGLAAAGALYPVPNVEEIKSANLEDAVASATINDVLYGYPMTADNGYFMYYNKSYFSESDVQTLDGMLAVAAENGKKITMDWSSGWYLYSFFGNTGMDFGVNEDGVTNHCNWNTTEGEITGGDIAQALLDISASPGFQAGGDADMLAGVADGSVIAGISGVWNAVDMQNAWGANLGAVKLPTYTVAGKQVQMASFTGYKLMGVNAYSAHPEWAAKLADWFTNEQNQTIRFEQRGQGPSNIKAAASDAVSASPAIQAVIAQSAYGKLQRVGNSYWNPCTDFGTIMAEGNPSDLKLQDIMDTMVAGITQSVAQ
ncbi:MAG: extracellular solute-binding protein [Muribaculaceae bacterium]|nr:extracellular solute-binding protein [Roseburia sp.]MCM1430322.1 extracellular solute-binding protein [Muribaculaceae bacterium]MCM1492482.1 extracellular solute-binding protein [Muribaculaceae bacterium]